MTVIILGEREQNCVLNEVDNEWKGNHGVVMCETREKKKDWWRLKLENAANLCRTALQVPACIDKSTS